MSSDLEIIVRPSQARDYTPGRVFYTPGQAGVPNTHLTIGKSGQGKMFNASFSVNVSYYVEQAVNEKDREL